MTGRRGVELTGIYCCSVPSIQIGSDPRFSGHGLNLLLLPAYILEIFGICDFSASLETVTQLRRS